LSASRRGGNAAVLWPPELGIAATNELIKGAVENVGSGLKQQIDAAMPSGNHFWPYLVDLDNHIVW
jgi:hypothetical protein